MLRPLTYLNRYVWLCLLLFFASLPALAAPPPTALPKAAPNPDLAATCGTRVIFVLDESGSLGTAGFSSVRTAMTAFLDGLKNTGSQVAIIEFSTEARFSIPYTTVTDTSITATFNPYLYGGDYGTGGSTNWDDALDEVKQLNATSGVAPLVVFMTDGIPNVFNGDYDGEPGGLFVNSLQAFWRAIDEANAIKTQGSHILSLGIGQSIDTTTLPFVSGADVSPPQPFDIATSDVMIVTNFALLSQSVRSIATQLCGSSITLTKYANAGDGLGYVARSAQNFVTTVASAAPGAQFDWASPQLISGPTAQGITNAAGKIAFQFRANGNFVYSTYIAETLPPDYRLVGASCNKQTAAGLHTPFTPGVGVNDLIMPPLNTTDIVTCDVFNATVGLTVEKYVSTSPDGPWVESLVLDAPASIYWFIIVTNTGGLNFNFALADSDISISQCNTGVANLPPGTQYYCLIDGGTAQPGTHINTVAVTACHQQAGFSDICKLVTDTALYKSPMPSVAVAIQGGTTHVSVGDTVTHAITVTNTGESPLTNLVVDVPDCGILTDFTPLGIGESRDYTCVRTVDADDNNGSDGLTQPVTVNTAEGASAFASATTPLGGRIVVAKVALPATAEVFDFQTSFGSGSWQISGGGSVTSDVLPPNNYSVLELAHAGWELNSVSCNDGSSNGMIQLAALETVICTFTNSLINVSGSITLTHDVNWNGVPLDPAQTFTVCIDAATAEPCRIFGAESGVQGWTDLPSGDYLLTLSPPGDQWSSDWGSLPVSISAATAAPGVILNTQRVCGVADRKPRVHMQSTLQIDWANNLAIGTVQNTSPICGYEIGLVAYEKPTEVLADQVIFAWTPDTTQPGKVPPETGSGAVLLPNSAITLQVPLPACAAQVDLIFDADALFPLTYSDPTAIAALALAPLILDEFETGLYGQYGNRYNLRLLQALHTNQLVTSIPLCGASAAAAFSAVPADTTIPSSDTIVSPPVEVPAESVASDVAAETIPAEIIVPDVPTEEVPADTAEIVEPDTVVPPDTPAEAPAPEATPEATPEVPVDTSTGG
jgi:uncharacterized repeat protein (TIGR01451 family)